jgi:hypothetical protein
MVGESRWGTYASNSCEFSRLILEGFRHPFNSGYERYLQVHSVGDSCLQWEPDQNYIRWDRKERVHGLTRRKLRPRCREVRLRCGDGGLIKDGVVLRRF